MLDAGLAPSTTTRITLSTGRTCHSTHHTFKFQHFLNSRPHELASFESAIAVAAVRSSLAQASRCLEAGSKWEEEAVTFQTSSSPDVSVNLAIIFLLWTKQLF